MILVCAQCGSDKGVKLISPDLDIEPVALCEICWIAIVIKEFR